MQRVMEPPPHLLKASPFVVPVIEPVGSFLYMAPSARELSRHPECDVPPVPSGCVRVVCISDTHNEHEGLRLPDGDVLIHTGDILTESGMRHVLEGGEVAPEGDALLAEFAHWFGAQRYEHKVLVGGNHDSVLEALGRERVQAILDASCAYGEVVYLQDNVATLGRLTIYGSPYAKYESHNNRAFFVQKPQYNIPSGVHVVATHMPAVLPVRDSSGARNFRFQPELTRPMFRAGPLLHVSGHVHSANGLYFADPRNEGRAFVESLRGLPGAARESAIPCVVASVCEKHWRTSGLRSSTGSRGDPADREHGGYNLVQPGIICDLLLPATDAQVPSSVAVRRPALLFFCPENDAGLVPVLLPQLEEMFCVHHVETVAAGVSAVGSQPYAACVAKLGTTGNLGKDVIKSLRAIQGSRPFVAIHSATAARNERTRASLRSALGIDCFVEHGREQELLEELRAMTQVPAEAAEPGDMAPQGSRPLLLFAPPNDAAFASTMLPLLEGDFDVDTAETVAQAVELLRGRWYAACLSKLGTAGNLGTDVFQALRTKHGSHPIIALHSAKAARQPKQRDKLARDFGVSIFATHGQEAELAGCIREALRTADPPCA